MLRSKFPPDIATRPLMAFFAALPILLILGYLAIVLLAAPKGAEDEAYFIPGFTTHIPVELRKLFIVLAFGAFGGAMNALMLSFDEDLHSPLRVAIASVIEAALGMMAALCVYIGIQSFMNVLLANPQPAPPLNFYALSFGSLIAGLLSPIIFEKVRLIGVAFFSIETREGVADSKSIATLRGVSDEAHTTSNDADGVAGRIARLENQVATLTVRPELDRFDGIAIVHLWDDKGGELPFVTFPKAAAQTKGGKGLQAVVSLDGEVRSSSHAFHGRIEVKDGQESDSVTFRVAVESEKITFTPPSDRVSFDPHGRSRTMAFAFRAPEREGTYEIFVSVQQKNRLLQVVRVALLVKDA